jgi:hypothetical protein
MKEEELRFLNEQVAIIENFEEQAKLTAEAIQAKFSIDDEYSVPRVSEFKLSDLISEFKDSVMRLIIKQHQKEFPNIPINSDELKELYKNQPFMSELIDRYIREKYIAKAEDLSLQEIVRKAGSVIPHEWEDGKKRRVSGDFRKGKKIILRVFWDSFVAGRVSLYSKAGKIIAFEKLLNIVLNGAKPSKAEGTAIFSVLNKDSDSDEEFFQKHPLFGHSGIASIRPYKNGKLEIEFESETDAIKLEKSIREGVSNG